MTTTFARAVGAISGRCKMADKDFLTKQFIKARIPKGSGKHEDFVKCQTVIGKQSKLSAKLYQEFLGIAREWVGI